MSVEVTNCFKIDCLGIVEGREGVMPQPVVEVGL